MTDTFTWKAQVNSSGDGEFLMSSSKFGDGYSQDVPNGLNSETQAWSVQVEGVKSKVQPVLDFIRSHKGVSFFWTPPLSAAPGYFKCKKYSLSDKGGSYWALTLNFEQGYAP
jgi:phage-related protein